MKCIKQLAAGLAGLGLWSTMVFAVPGDPNYEFVKSESPTVLRIDVADVRYDFNGSATIPFTLNNSRAHVWLVVYTKDQKTTGGNGGPTSPIAPQGALWRKPGLPNMVAVVDKGQFEVGSHTVTWDGKDWQGNRVPQGNYSLYLVGLNDLDDTNIIGPGGGSGNGYGRVSVDANYPRKGQYTLSIQGGAGIMRYQIGAQNWLQDPVLKTAAPVYELFPNLGLSYATDSEDPNIGYLASVYAGGVAKFRWKDGSAAEPVREFGPEGTGLRPAADITSNAPKFQSIRERDGKLYITHGDWGQDPPQSELIILDKMTGKTLGTLDLSEWFNVEGVNKEGNLVAGSNGPAVLHLDEQGIWLGNGGWGTGADAQGPDGGADFGLFMKVGYDGNPIWINNNGDGFGDSISPPTADALGMAPQQQGVQTIWGVPVSSTDAAAGFSAIAEIGPDNDSFGAIIGPDGAGIMHVRLTKAGNQSPWQTGNLIIQDGSAYDGFYFVTGSSNPSTQQIRDKVPTAIALGFVPFDIAKAVIGSDVSTAVEELETAVTPRKFSLKDATPNPFNPSTTIEFEIAQATYARLEIYNTTGQKVKTLVDQTLASGSYRTVWDALDEQGKQVSTGTYLYTLTTQEFRETKRFTFLK